MHPTVSLVAGPLKAGAPVVAVPVRPGDPAPALAAGADVVAALGVDAAAVLAARKAKGEPGEVIEVPVARDGVDTLAFVGIGDGQPAALRKAAAALVRRAGAATAVATNLADGAEPEGFAAVTEAATLARFSFSRRSEPSDKPPLDVRLVGPARDKSVTAAVADAITIAEATCLARELAATPSLEKTPEWMVGRIRDRAAGADLDVTVWDEQRLAAEGFGGISAVGRASARPPRLVRLDYSPRRGSGGRVVLVGKGITFDSGGLSLKPLDNMKLMKTDMSGAAAVVATMSALKRLGVRRPVTALVPLAENLIGGDAMRPGDVLRQYGGRYVEVLNTDAEGRLVLADALAYAVAHLDPAVVIDLATLTGAATLGLGKRHAALYTTDPSLRDALVAAGARGGERLWPMPLVESYRDSLESPVADLRNIGDPDKNYSGGSIVAALFLREFVG
ncbi:MAG: leucyl aminopeptidase, partial [Frankiaceae bacterium]|nr:leucyl aminopeptidase [Frankiaceae bacterium]